MTEHPVEARFSITVLAHIFVSPAFLYIKFIYPSIGVHLCEERLHIGYRHYLVCRSHNSIDRSMAHRFSIKSRRITCNGHSRSKEPGICGNDIPSTGTAHGTSKDVYLSGICHSTIDESLEQALYSLLQGYPCSVTRTLRHHHYCLSAFFHKPLAYTVYSRFIHLSLIIRTTA